MRPDRISARKNFLHLLRACIGGDIDIFRRKPAHHVPDATTGEVGDMAVLAELCRNRARGFLHGRRAHTGSVAAPLWRGELESRRQGAVATTSSLWRHWQGVFGANCG